MNVICLEEQVSLPVTDSDELVLKRGFPIESIGKLSAQALGLNIPQTQESPLVTLYATPPVLQIGPYSFAITVAVMEPERRERLRKTIQSVKSTIFIAEQVGNALSFAPASHCVWLKSPRVFNPHSRIISEGILGLVMSR